MGFLKSFCTVSLVPPRDKLLMEREEEGGKDGLEEWKVGTEATLKNAVFDVLTFIE